MLLGSEEGEKHLTSNNSARAGESHGEGTAYRRNQYR